VCGRFVQTTSPERLALRFGAIDTIDDHRPRYNVAPSTPVPAVLDAGGRRLGLLHWGFVPPWARDPDSGPRPINARVEGVSTSRLFGPALARRRCVVPVDAWYEWTDEAGARQPWLLAPASEGPVAVAAIWSSWRADDAPTSNAPPVGTVALITTEARGRARDIHDRMPLLVPDVLLDDWLDPTRTEATDVLGALTAEETELRTRRVSRRVNHVRNDDPSLLDEVLA
jgi:putative SOS response-associated peptidase YedK